MDAADDLRTFRASKRDAREIPARRYASFVIRGRQLGEAGPVEIAHEQSGERIRAASMAEAIGWMQSRSAAPAPARRSDAVLNTAPDEEHLLNPPTKGGEWRALVGVECAGRQLGAAA